MKQPLGHSSRTTNTLLPRTQKRLDGLCLFTHHHYRAHVQIECCWSCKVHQSASLSPPARSQPKSYLFHHFYLLYLYTDTHYMFCGTAAHSIIKSSIVRVGGAGTIQCRCSFIFFVTRWNNDEWDPGKKWLQDVLISPHQASPLLSTYLHTKQQQERTIGVSNTALSFSLSLLGLSPSLPAALYWWLYMNSQRQGKRSSSRILGAIMQTCSYQQLQDMYVTAPCAITSV